jgi:6-phosphogluconolactonase
MKVHVVKDAAALSVAVAEWMTSLIEKTLAKKTRFCLLLSGGNTPKNLYKLLAEDPYRKRIDWSKLHVFFGDERIVPFNDERNNGKMAYDSLLSKVPIPENQVHFVDTSIDPGIAAENYERLLRRYFNSNHTTFDLALLGMGDDGHTLSLFPGNDSINENKNWAFSVFVPSQQMQRISLTPEVVNRSACIAFLVTGAAKTTVLSQVLNEAAAPHFYPVQLIKPLTGDLHWFADEEAVRG